MSQVLPDSPLISGFNPGGYVLNFAPVVTLTDDQLFEFAGQNRDLRIERTPTGEITVMSPTDFEGGRRNAIVTAQLTAWARRDGTGVACDSSTGYVLENGAMRAPDVSWLSLARLSKFTADERRKFLRICPEFVIELRSETDTLPELKSKMQEYIACGAKLGWLIDPLEKRAYLYRPNQAVEQLENPETLSGDPVLRNFVLDLRDVWK